MTLRAGTVHRPGLLLAAGSGFVFLATLSYVESGWGGWSEVSFRNSYFHLFRTGLPVDVLPFLQGLAPQGDTWSLNVVLVAIAVLALLGVLLLLATRNLLLTLALLTAPLLAGLAAQILKDIIVRPPPLNSYSGHSLPSGHAAVASALALGLAFAIRNLRLATPLRLGALMIVAGALALALMSAITLHYPTDVLAGVALGGLWIGAARTWAEG